MHVFAIAFDTFPVASDQFKDIFGWARTGATISDKVRHLLMGDPILLSIFLSFEVLFLVSTLKSEN